jgi:hypothetical protein
VVNQSLVLRINICGENRHLRQARNRYRAVKKDSQPHGQAHLVFSKAQANTKKPKELAPTPPRQNSG